MVRTSSSTGVDSVVKELGRPEIQSGLMTVPEVLQQELRFLKMFTFCLMNCQEAGKDVSLTSAIVRVEAMLKEAGFFTEINDKKGEDLDWVLAPSLLEKIEQIEPGIREICGVLLDSLTSMSCSSDEILAFMECLVENLKNLENLEADKNINVVSVKNKIISLEQKLSFLKDFVDFSAKRCIERQKLEDLLDYVKGLVHNGACVSLLCLLEGKDEKMVQRLDTLLSDLLQKIKPCRPNFDRMFVGLLKASEPSRSDKLVVGQIVTGLADFLLEGLGGPLKDCVHILKEGLIFMITFVMDPAEEAVTNAGDGLFARINTAIDEILSVIFSLYMDESKVDISLETKLGLSRLRDEIDKLRAEIGKLYVRVPNSSDFNFPTTNGMGFVDFILENLKEMLKLNPKRIVFAKHQVMIVQEELLSLKPLLQDIMELQTQSQDLKDLWKRIINTVFLADHVIASCLIIDHPIWYDILQLSNVIQAIKLIEIETKMKHSGQMHKTRMMTSTETNSSHFPTKQGNPSSLHDAVVGWEDESMAIIGKLKRGTAKLDIVSIVGMPGLGKTTLARKVYNDLSLKYYFNRRAWCCVSQMYKLRELYFDILSDITGVDARESDSSRSEDDLAEKLRKCLKGLKYLIVLDDIWSIEAWERIKGSFPDDNNGSRIMFTSRIHNLVSQAKINCSPHPLRPLSDEESWQLLQEKLFHKDSCHPDDLSKLGKNIAKNCKGLPLAVVLVAGILASKNIEFWKQIEETTSSQVVSEGCMDVLELSYKHLPDNLKPCFLYFGAFPEDRVVKPRKLMSLWIAEGLIPRVDKKSSYEAAEDYLSDLIDRSLVILEERSSDGGIKACRVHDLLRDLCSVKIQEDNFLQRVRDDDTHSNSKKYENYRLCIDAEWPKFVDTKPTGLFVHSLILVGDYHAWQLFPCPSSLFKSFKLLNVLDLECIMIDGPFPEEVTLIVHLRYLAIWCHPTEIPDSIANLWNLETLIVKGSASDLPLPRTIWQMKSLRHVHIPSMWLNGLEDHEFCQLEHLDIFSTPHLNSGNETKELLRRLPRLRKLKCNFLERPFTYEPYKFPELSRLTDLESLKLYSYGLVFFGKNRDRFPAFDFPSSLRRLTLGRFTLPWSTISVIGQLPNLEVLKLRSRAFSGQRWDAEDGEFLKLKLLELRQLDIQQWTVPDDEPFPSLERLTVKDCYSLDGIPTSLGYIATLKKIEMRWCFQASKSAREILQEQQEMGNDNLEVVVFN